MHNSNIDEEEIIKCFHCGNETIMKKVGEYSWGSRDYEYSDFDFLYQYEMFACPICHKVTLRETYGDENMIEGYDIPVYGNEKTVLYPLNSIDSTCVPEKIKNTYEAALKTKGVDKYIGLLALRRTLELILNEQGAIKWGLKDKIEEIAAQGKLPDALKEASVLAKMLGDTAAHDKELVVDDYDVEAIAEFLGFIIQYLYVVPDKINMYKKHLDEKTIQEN